MLSDKSSSEQVRLTCPPTSNNVCQQVYAKILLDLGNNGKLFQDKCFKLHLNTSSTLPCNTNNQLLMAEGSPIVWKRPIQLTSQPEFIDMNFMGPSKILRGQAGNSCLVATMNWLAQRRELLNLVVPGNQVLFGRDYRGIVRFNFWPNGQLVTVVIDDRLPTIGGKLIYARKVPIGSPMEYWPSLLEKAVAKLYGSYWAMEAGDQSEFFLLLTNGLTKSRSVEQLVGMNQETGSQLEEGTQQMNNLKPNVAQLFQLMKETLDRSGMILVSTDRIGHSSKNDTSGVQLDQSNQGDWVHGLEFVPREGNTYMIRHLSANLIGEKCLNILDPNRPNQAIEIPLEKIINFSKIIFGYLRPATPLNYQIDIGKVGATSFFQHRNRWQKRHQTYFYQANTKTLCGAPVEGSPETWSLVYSLKVTNKTSLGQDSEATGTSCSNKLACQNMMPGLDGGNVIISLMQKSNRAPGGSFGHLIGINLYEAKLYLKRDETQVGPLVACSEFGTNLEVNMNCNLPPGDYLVAPIAFHNQIECEFLLRIWVREF